jgi:hypothetical protein
MMLHDLLDPFLRVWSDITSGVHAPLGFRLVVQPLVAAFFAVRAGRMDARDGRPLYFWAVVKDAVHRRALLREGWKHVGKVFITAIIVDVIYQVIVERWVYPFEAIMVGVVLAVLPYLIFRGLVNRILRRRYPGQRPA